MVAYNKSDLIPPGTKVKVAPWTAPYAGWIGTVVEPRPGELTRSTVNPKRTITRVQIPGRKGSFGFYTNNLERIEEVTNYNNLVGPKPEPVREPEHPTPWVRQGRVILDANGVQVLKVSKSSEYQSIPLDKAYKLTQALVDAVNGKFSKEDAPSPF